MNKETVEELMDNMLKLFTKLEVEMFTTEVENVSPYPDMTATTTTTHQRITFKIKEDK